jgi:8-oxo-dGTP diphosphatase
MIFPTHIVAVCGLIKNEKDEILLVKHPNGWWDVPGGQVEEGEDLISGLERETLEETGVTIKANQLIAVYSNVQPRLQYDGISKINTQVILAFSGLKVNGELITSDESIEVGWFSQSEIEEKVRQETCYSRTIDFLSFNGDIIYRAYMRDPYEIKKECII